MQAITIKYLSATNTKSARWKATAASGSVTVSHDYDFDTDGNVKAVVKALLVKLDWTAERSCIGNWIIGQLYTGHYAAVCAGFGVGVQIDQ